jgi:hypothetical protein
MLAKPINGTTWAAKVKLGMTVYLMTIHKRAERLPAICNQSEWDAMELLRPGYHQLVQSGIATETKLKRINMAAPASCS